MKVLILGGAGHIGAEIASELRSIDSNAEIVLGDINEEKGREVARKCDGYFLKIDVEKELNGNFLRNYDVVVNSIGPFYRFGILVLKAALNAGVKYVDINDDYDATMKALELVEEAKKNGFCALIGMGATPGITNILSFLGSKKMDEVETIGTYWVWTGIDPDVGNAIINHYFHAIDGFVPSYRNGKLVNVEALSEAEFFDFPEPIGRWEVANVGHPEPITIPKYIKVKNVLNKGGIWPYELSEFAKFLSMVGLSSLKEIRFRDVIFKARDLAVELATAIHTLMPEDRLQRMMEKIYNRLGNFALKGLGLSVFLKGLKNSEKVEIKYSIAFEDATLATALPAAIAAKEIMKSEESGIFPPEANIIDIERLLNMTLDSAEIFEETTKRTVLKI
ncbi:MAG: saccharopine dehydrogenase NADP-binding domain-containing protein [Archaeoglobaceae archaeon]